MTREKSNKKKFEKSKKQIVMEYLRTISVTFAVALVFTLLLSLHARNEMIRNYYLTPSERFKIDEKVAKSIVTQSDLTRDLLGKKYAICMQVARLYESIQDYPNAEFAYRIAVNKSNSESYSAHQGLASMLITQEKFQEANEFLDSIKDIQNKNLIKFKTRAYITMGDKYYSIGKYLSAAKNYEKANYYYSKFAKKDNIIDKEIKTRIIKSYIQTADVMVNNGRNSDAIRFLKHAEKYDFNNFEIKYKLAIIYSDLDPEKSVKYFETLLQKSPQHIDYGVFNKALLKSANIADIRGDKTLSKYYRYKIHSVDIFIDRKVVYSNDIDVILQTLKIKKIFLKYRIKARYKFCNQSNTNIKRLTADFILRQNNKNVEKYTKEIVTSNKPLTANGGETKEIEVKFGKHIFTKKELNQYYIDIYLYKDEKYKTLVASIPVLQSSK